MNNRKTLAPQQAPFKLSNQIFNTFLTFEIIAISISILLGIISQLASTQLVNKLVDILSITSITLVIILSILEKLNSYFFEKAQEARRCGFFDNSFGSRTATCESRKYYDNDDVPMGLMRLLANLHENSIYTNFISAKMFKRHFYFLIPIFIAILYLFYVGFINSLFGNLLLNTLLSYHFLDRSFSLYELKTGTASIEEKCRSLWIQIDTSQPIDIEKLEPQILELQTSYDVLLSTTKVQLSTKLKDKNNSILKKKWNAYKQRFILGK